MKRLAIIISILFPVVALAQGFSPWTLEKCVSYALEHNIDIKQQELKVETRSIAVNESNWAYSPSVGINSTGSISTGRVLDQTTYQFIKNSTVGSTCASIYGSMNIFNGFKKLNTLKYSMINLQIGEAELEVLKRNVTKVVIADYLALLCAESELETAIMTRDLVIGQLERIKNLVDLGRVTESDYLQARAQLFSAEKDITTARGSVEMARLELCALLEIHDSDSFLVTHEEFDMNSLSPEQLGLDAIESLPEFRQVSIGMELANKDLQIAKSTYWPSLSLSAGYGSSSSSARQKNIQNPDGTFRYEAYPFLEQYADNASSYVSISLNIPIFNAMTTRNAIRKKEIILKSAEYSVQSKRSELSKEYNQARIDCETAYQKYLTSLGQVEFAEKAEKEIRERYNLGHADYLSWKTAVSELSKSRVSLLEAQFTYVFRKKILDLYINSF